MRKNTLIAVFLAAMSVAFIGCKNQGGEGAPATSADSAAISAAAEENAPAVESTVSAESLKLKKAERELRDESGNLYSVVKLHYPVEGPPALVDAIRQYIIEKLSNPDILGNERYAGDMSDGQQVADWYAERYMAEMKSQMAEMAADGATGVTGMSIHADIHKKWGNGNCVTYEACNEQFMAGAHGSYSVEGMTFRRSDGERVTDYFELGNDDVLKKLIAAEQREEEAREAIMNAAMPQSTPYLVDGGVKVNYQLYEVGAYAIGVIETTLPTDKVAPYLVPEVKALLK